MLVAFGEMEYGGEENLVQLLVRGRIKIADPRNELLSDEGLYRLA
jgi:hypothetical protein